MEAKWRGQSLFNMREGRGGLGGGSGWDEDEGGWSRVGQPGRRRTRAGQVRVKQGLSAILRQGQHNSLVHTMDFKTLVL